MIQKSIVKHESGREVLEPHKRKAGETNPLETKKTPGERERLGFSADHRDQL
jgi:hypothetical protein